VQNYGLRRGTISYTIVRDCVSEAMVTMDELNLAALAEVGESRSAGRRLASAGVRSR
jgi:hypothetical protein